ncbi:MAG TPA: PQQ-binding-like beta-propeller repeat protein [Acidobacteriota bacterium]|nr:PQQ-binding-like beta-propeller repeat protein [Acidobacteriota bacterium]
MSRRATGNAAAMVIMPVAALLTTLTGTTPRHQPGYLAEAAAQRSGPAHDWPQLRGPNADGISPQTGLLTTWPESGPREIWRVPLGKGFSGISVVGERAFTMFGRGGTYLGTFDTATGDELWQLRIDEMYRNSSGDGPRSTPTVDDGTVYVISGRGIIAAVDAETGATRWRHNLREEYRAAGPNWGFSASPKVYGNLILVEAGAPDAALLAFDKRTGEEVWRATGDPPGYSTPLLVQIGGLPQAVFFTGRRIAGVNPSSGALLWDMPWETTFGVNAATPVFVPPDKIFVSSGYGVGAALLRVVPGSAGGVETVWRTREMKNQFSSSVLVDDYIYGFDNSMLECIELSRGERMWRARGHGQGSLLYADDHLIVLGDRGSLALVKLSPGEYLQVSRAQVFRGRTWTAPTLANGVLYLRDEQELVALEITEATIS